MVRAVRWFGGRRRRCRGVALVCVVKVLLAQVVAQAEQGRRGRAGPGACPSRLRCRRRWMMRTNAFRAGTVGHRRAPSTFGTRAGRGRAAGSGSGCGQGEHGVDRGDAGRDDRLLAGQVAADCGRGRGQVSVAWIRTAVLVARRRSSPRQQPEVDADDHGADAEHPERIVGRLRRGRVDAEPVAATARERRARRRR